MRRGAVAPVEEVITPEEAEKEFYIFRLRIAEGFSESEFEERFGKKIPAEVKAVLASHVASGLLANENDRWFYTRKGLDFADQVARDLLSFGLV